MDIMLFVLFALGIFLIVKGGDWFVDAATWMAEVSGVPKFIVGATVVSFATTLPELLVSSIATYQGKTTMAIGNAVGSVIANLGLIMAIGLLCMPSVIKRSQIALKGAVMILASASLLVLTKGGSLSVTSGLVLVAIFLFFMFDNIREARASNAPSENVPKDKATVRLNILKFIGGAAGIVIGAQLLVDKGSAIARLIGIPESVIGLTAIAIGTSLPELVTTVTSIIKKQSSMSVGNIIGANIIDLTMILPVCSIISGGTLAVEATTAAVDLPVSLVIMAIIIVPAVIKGRFYRWQGAASLAVYCGYLGYMFF